MKKRGKLIVIEAGDASGKATQTKLLVGRLREAGHPVRRIEFPDYGSESSALVRMYLRGDFGAQPSEVDAYAASIFFAADRYASFRIKWKKYYDAGETIIADRYVTSNLVHQAVKIGDAEEREKYASWLFDLEYLKLNLPRPDAVVFLDMPPTISLNLLKARKSSAADIHESDEDYLRRCYAAYEDAAKKYGWIRIACGDGDLPRTPESIADDVYSAISKIIAADV